MRNLKQGNYREYYSSSNKIENRFHKNLFRYECSLLLISRYLKICPYSKYLLSQVSQFSVGFRINSIINLVDKPVDANLFLPQLAMASCDNCKKGAVLPGEPTGTMVNGAYLAAGPEGNTSRAIILLTDIFGLPLINCKIIADNISKRLQCDVWVPDLFNGPFRTMISLLLWPHQYTRQTSYHGRQTQSSRARRREN